MYMKACVLIATVLCLVDGADQHAVAQLNVTVSLVAFVLF